MPATTLSSWRERQNIVQFRHRLRSATGADALIAVSVLDLTTRAISAPGSIRPGADITSVSAGEDTDLDQVPAISPRPAPARAASLPASACSPEHRSLYRANAAVTALQRPENLRLLANTGDFNAPSAAPTRRTRPTPGISPRAGRLWREQRRFRCARFHDRPGGHLYRRSLSLGGLQTGTRYFVTFASTPIILHWRQRCQCPGRQPDRPYQQWDDGATRRR